MKKSWPTLACPSGSGEAFWEHEWEKHGTCSQSVIDQHQYFQTALGLKQKTNLLGALTKAGTLKSLIPGSVTSRLDLMV